MRTPVSVLAGCLLPALLAACRSDGPTTAPAFAAASAAAQSGAVVVRWEGNEEAAGLFIFDGERHLMAALMSDDSYFGCAGGTTVGNSANQLIEAPAGPTNYLSRVDDVFVTVYDWSSPVSLTCALLLGPTALARGVVPGLLTDNDVFGAGGRANSFGMGVRGEVESLADGERLQLTAHFRTLFTPGGSGATTSQVSLTPDPRE